ncbi:NUDIX hydrolase [Lederbergia citri]|uniref:NUDIX hydrolase n=1 Tax=Lederbergia citri TaxID=2833580 RepID=A0A942YFR1_9BACI|nr:NUDIX hydrolase [Lederbergia citri]MBS4193580.1 NUDIX hydrolase [Lederbergia citri]
MKNEHPKHIIAVSAYVTNENGELLLVKTHSRSDTWECPGGQVEMGEPLDEVVCREVLEETGIVIRPIGITGIYYNTTSYILSVVFKAAYVSGKIKIQPEEIREARFIKVKESNIEEYITRPHMRSRTIDAMNVKNFIPYETWEVEPYQLTGRLEGDWNEG